MKPGTSPYYMFVTYTYMYDYKMCAQTNLSWVDNQRHMYVFGACKIPQCRNNMILGKKSIVPTAERKSQNSSS